jgi:hypothetical protein
MSLISTGSISLDSTFKLLSGIILLSVTKNLEIYIKDITPRKHPTYLCLLRERANKCQQIFLKAYFKVKQTNALVSAC